MLEMYMALVLGMWLLVMHYNKTAKCISLFSSSDKRMMHSQ